MIKRLSNIDQNNVKLENVPTPVNDGDAVNKLYVDAGQKTFSEGITENENGEVRLGGTISDDASQTQIRYDPETAGLFIGPSGSTGGTFQVNDNVAQFTYSSSDEGSSGVSLYGGLAGIQATNVSQTQDNVFIVTPTTVQSFAYPNNRNDSGSSTPINYIYTDSEGIFRSAPLTGIAANKVDKGSLVYNVKDYGATGNGTTDDTAAFQAAIDAASVTLAKGATVFMPYGTYLINGTVNIPSSIALVGASMDNGTTITGSTIKAGSGTGPVLSIMGTPPSSGDLVSTAPIKRVTLRDFTIRGTGTSRTLLRAFYTNRNNFKNVRFIGTSGNAVHGVEFWDTTFDACTFDLTGSSTNASVLLQNMASSTASNPGYSNDNINRLTFRGCTWETFTSTCIALDATTGGGTHLANNITIDDCKFETSTFQNPFITTTNRVASVYVLNSYFAANNKDAGYSGGAKDMITSSGSSTMVNNSRFYQGATGLVTSAVHFTNHSGQNIVNGLTCNWSGFAPTSGAAVLIDTPATPTEDSITNVRADAGKKLIDNTGYSSFKSHQNLTAEADRLPSFVWNQTGTNPKKMTLGLTASGNFSMIPDNGALWTVKKPDNTNFAVFDMTTGRLAGGTNSTNVAPTAGLFAAGSFGQAVTAKTSSFTFAETDGVILANAASGAMTATLPDATTVRGRILEIKKVDSSSNNITVATVSSQTIEGSSTKTITGQWSHAKYQSDGTNWIQLSSVTATGATAPDALTRTITQSSHGFAVGDVLRYNGTAYVKAQANSSANADVDGIVSSVTNTNTFVLTLDGYITGLSGLTAGTSYFLSATTAGALTSTAPTTVGQVNYFLLKAISTSAGFLRNHRGDVISAAASGDVTGPASSESDIIPVFDGVTGKLLKSSHVTASYQDYGSGDTAATIGTDASILQIYSPNATAISSGSISISADNGAPGSNEQGGDITFTAGTGDGSGIDGTIKLNSELKVNYISERNPNTGVSIEDVPIKDGLVDGVDVSAQASKITANGMGVVVHGSTASTARPTGFAQITWIGTVAPANAATNDIWWNNG